MDEIIINGEGLILGRLAASAAKLAKQGTRVSIINSEKIILTGRKKKIKEDYLQKIHRGSAEKGPYFPKRADRLVKRTIRGMLNYKSPTGRKAFSRIKAYIGEPEEYAGKASKEFKCKSINDLKRASFVTVGEICKEIGGKQ